MTDGGTGDETASATSTISHVASPDKDPEFFEYSNPWQFFAIAFGVSYLFW
ncbi:CPBP family intramembrane metalloprotease domain-containing protein, partial [Natronococcus pandeyae]